MFRAGLWPLKLALVDTSANFAARHKAAATGCAVMRTATVVCLPRIEAGTALLAGTIHVTGRWRDDAGTCRPPGRSTQRCNWP